MAEAITDFKGNLRSSYTARDNDYSPSSIPTLTYDPKKKLDPNDDREGARDRPGRRRRPITIEGMPIGLFENELTVQLWQPVTIRGYTFNVGDNVTLDQTKIAARRPPVGGDFAWLYATYQAERTGKPFDTFWNRLPPPLLREGNKVQTPWLTAFLKDPHMIRPAAQLRMPRFHFGKIETGPVEGNRAAGQLLRRARPGRVPLSDDPRAEPQLSGRAQQGPSRLPGGRLADDDEQGLAVPSVPRDRPVQAQRRRRRSSTGPTFARSPAGSARTILEAWIANPRRLLPFTAMPQNIAPHGTVQILVPKTFENKPIDMVRAVRDTLLNYVNAVELQLASSSPATRGRRPERLPRPSGNSPLNGPATDSQQERRRNVHSLDPQTGDSRAELQRMPGRRRGRLRRPADRSQ